MKKTLLTGTLFLLITLLVPLLMTGLFSRNYSSIDLPNVDDIRIYASSEDTLAMDLEDYVTGVVLATIPVNYEYETLKAQAVIARTYALKNISLCEQNQTGAAIIESMNPHSTGYTTTELGLPYVEPSSYLAYMGTMEYETYLTNVENAVKETEGQIITYDNGLITPLFFSTSAGKTRDSGDLWSLRIPYLISVDSNQDVESSSYLNVSILTLESVIEELQTAYQQQLLDASDYDYQVYTSLPIDADSFFDTVEIIKRDSVGYVLTVSLGGILVSGESFASALGLNSSYFYIEDYEDSVRIICNGSGHGIGFSQYGANVLAKRAEYNYIGLITYYYTDVKVQKVSKLY